MTVGREWNMLRHLCGPRDRLERESGFTFTALSIHKHILAIYSKKGRSYPSLQVKFAPG